MVSFKVLLSTVALCTTLTAAQASSAQASSAQAPSAEKLKELQALKAAQAAYPKCALACMAKLIPQSTCSATDLECLCTNQALNVEIAGCALGACTLYEGLETKNVSMTMCGAPVRDKSVQPIAIALVFGIMALIAFILRVCAVLANSGRSVGLDDCMISLAVALAVPPTVFAFTLVQNGLGKDMWTLTLSQIKNLLRYYYLGELFYFGSITATKIAILLFILRVFPDETFRRLVYATCGLCAAWGISFLFATAFQCSPVAYSWEQIDESWGKGTCNNIHLQGWLSAISNILVDLLVLSLPLKNLWGLNMDMKKKIKIMVMFSVGIFVTIISILRLRSLIVFANTSNVSWDYTESAWWSTMEMHVAIVCACLPAINQLFRLLFGSKEGTTGKSYGSSKASSGKQSASAGPPSQTYSHRPPKRGDESDFMPLVDYNGSKVSDKGSAYSVNVASKGDSMA